MARAIARAAGEPASLLLTRFTVDFLRPVPIAPLSVNVEQVRDGRRARGYAARLSAGGREVARATALLVRMEAVEPPPFHAADRLAPPPDASAPFEWPFFEESVGYPTGMDTRLAGGRFGSGRAAAWMRPRVPLVAGEPTSPLERTLIVADSGSGIGAAVDPARLVPSINADLTVSLHRLPAGDWIGLDASTALERYGIGLTRTVLHDERGPIGQALQSLVLAEPGPR